MGWLQGGKNLKEAPAYGADVLRLWVASVDYNSDVLIGDRILSQVLVNNAISHPLSCCYRLTIPYCIRAKSLMHWIPHSQGYGAWCVSHQTCWLASIGQHGVQQNKVGEISDDREKLVSKLMSQLGRLSDLLQVCMHSGWSSQWRVQLMFVFMHIHVCIFRSWVSAYTIAPMIGKSQQ